MLLFFYGVLLGSVAEGRIRTLLHGLGPGRPASTSGRLYAVAERGRFYPALVPGEGTVHGMAHEAGTVDLAALDRFENVRSDGTGEYRRVPIRLLLGGGTEGADAYLYNRPIVAGLVPIEHGDFARWLRNTGALAFAEA
jgi:gamma-glutamylcyclotransferase (GGCT)/AIG2-like uncharacterized protein YtfP